VDRGIELPVAGNVVGIFTDDASVILLVGAVLLDQHDDWAIAERRYLSEESMAHIDTDPEQSTTTNTPHARLGAHLPVVLGLVGCSQRLGVVCHPLLPG
jgi:hypothetical protein